MIPLPAYIDPEAWAGFVEMRRKIKAPLTVRAATLILFELQRIKDAGHDPNASLDQSTMKCWRDVWPLKDKEIHRTREADAAAREEEARRAADEAWRKRTPEQIEAAKAAKVAALSAVRRIA